MSQAQRRPIIKKDIHRFATGRYAKAVCDKCGLVMQYTDLVKEWTGLLVHRECCDPYPPQLNEVIVSDGIALQHPRPDITFTYAEDGDTFVDNKISAIRNMPPR